MTAAAISFRARLVGLGTTVCVVLAVAPIAVAQVGDSTDLPVLSPETRRGSGTTAPAGTGVTPVAKTVDGDISDWVGAISRYGGTAVYSGGEYVYQDHIFDAYGPDDGRDARRLAQTDPLVEKVPGLYRVDALAQADAAGELGVNDAARDAGLGPSLEEYQTNDSYGDARDRVDGADLEEVRLATDADSVYLLARTTTMTAPTTGLVVLADTQPGTAEHDVPFGSGISSTVADVAFFLNGSSGFVVDLGDPGGTPQPLPAGSVATQTSGFTNAIEARLPLGMVASPKGLTIAIASGTANTDGTGFAPLQLEEYAKSPQEHANVANIAFRPDEPVRIWFERDQALSLFAGTIDPFFTTVELGKLLAAASEDYVPGHGYHDRIFISDSAPQIVHEQGMEGRFQHYGVYLPESYDGAAQLPLQWWLHWRGGNAHTAGAVIPKMFKQYGEDKDTIVVSPSARGSSTWYVSKGHVDFLEVWKDVLDTYSVDDDHVYVSGHSMGGFGSFLMTVLYPDRFAAGVPASPPVTQGAWTGLDFPGCDDYTYEEYSFCYVQANNGRARDQHTRKLLKNLRHVPLAIFAGVEDELVPFSGVARQAEELTNLGYRYRLYANLVAEHYTPPVMDQWSEVADYEHAFTRDANPSRVTYTRDMPFERATEEVGVPQNTGLHFDFDSAYWMSELTPADPTAGVASFDGVTLGIPEAPYIAAPDTDAPTAVGQAGPYVVAGLQWLADVSKPVPARSNAFRATLTGASSVRLDLDRMEIDSGDPITGTITTNRPLDLRLDGGWVTAPVVTGGSAAVTLVDGVLTVHVAAGTTTIAIASTSTAGAI